MGGIVKSRQAQQPVETVKEMATPAAQSQAASADRASAEEKAATRRASRRGGMRGQRALMSNASLGGDSATLGSVAQ